MSAVKALPQVQDIVEEIDRLIAEMTVLRSQVSALGFLPVQSDRSGDEADKLEQMEQAANDPLFMADLRETMSAFAGLDFSQVRCASRLPQ